MDETSNHPFPTDDSVTQGERVDIESYPQGPPMANFNEVQPPPTTTYEEVYPEFNQHPPAADLFSYQAYQTQNMHTTGGPDSAFNGGYPNHQLLQPPFMGNTFNNPLTDFGLLSSTASVTNPTQSYAPTYGVPLMYSDMHQDMMSYATNMGEERIDPHFLSHAGFLAMQSDLGVPTLSEPDALSISGTYENALYLGVQPAFTNTSVADYNDVHDAPPQIELINTNAGQNLPALPAIAPTPESSTRSTPDLTDESGTSSPSVTQGPPQPSKKRARSEDSDTVQTSVPSAETFTDEKKVLCGWRRLFGGDCNEYFCKAQQYDRHILGHLPDADGSVWYTYMCKRCPRNTGPEGTRATKKIKWKKEDGGFSRKDSGLRHVRTWHNDVIENGDVESHIYEVDRPWWWPIELFQTEHFKDEEKVGPRPEGETRDWQAYFRDVISKYPDVVDKPFEGAECDEGVRRPRRFKRQRTTKH